METVINGRAGASEFCIVTGAFELLISSPVTKM